MASYKGHLEVVKYLVKNSADVEHTDTEGDSGLSLAKDENHKDIVAYLESVRSLSYSEITSTTTSFGGRGAEGQVETM